MKLVAGIVVVLLLGGIAAYDAVYQVMPDEQGVIIRFGEPVRTEPAGLHVKIPLIEDVFRCTWATVYRHQERSIDVALSDQSKSRVDATITYRIGDCLQFYETVRNPPALAARVRELAKSSVHKAIGRYSNRDLLDKGKEDAVVEAARAEFDAAVRPFGGEITRVELSLFAK